MADPKTLLRDVSATLETVIERINQIEDHPDSDELPEDVLATLANIQHAARKLRRYR